MGRMLSSALLLGLVAQTAAHLSIVCTATSGQQPNTFAFWFITYHSKIGTAPGQVHIQDPTGRTLSAPFSDKCRPTADIKGGTGQTAADYEHSLKTHCLGLKDPNGNSPIFEDSVVTCYNKDTLTPLPQYAIGVTGDSPIAGYYGQSMYDHYYVILSNQYTKTGSYVTHFTDVDVNMDACPNANLPCSLADYKWTFEISVITSPPKCTTAPPAGLVANTVAATLAGCDGSVKDIEAGILCHAQCISGYAKIGVLSCVDQMDGTAAWNPNFQCSAEPRCFLPSSGAGNIADVQELGGVMPPCSTVTPAGTTCQYTCKGSDSTPKAGKVRCEATGVGLNAVWKQDAGFEACPPPAWTIGCYDDAFGASFTRQLPTLAYEGPDNSVSSCLAECKKLGFTYAGVEFGEQCWCGNSMAGGRRVMSTDCEVMDCTKDNSEKCGDKYKLKVYQFSEPASVFTPVLEGCYVDDAAHTKLPHLMFWETEHLTNEECAAVCQTRGFRYSGTQAGRECYCGDDLSTSTRINTEACDTDCTGDSSSKCGGAFKNTVYSLTFSSASFQPKQEGCYKDEGLSHKLPHLAYISPVNTLTECAKTCRHNGFTYAGLQFGTQCWCGDDLSTSTRTLFDECDAPCPGNVHQVCGKAFRNLVVSVQSTPTNSNPVLEGCFEDADTDKFPTLAYMTETANTIAECALTCQHNGFTYAGLQHGSQCWCGNDLSTSTRTTITECNTPCSGDSTMNCGGAFRNQVYALKPVAPKGNIVSMGCHQETWPTRQLSKRTYTDLTGNTISECTKTCYHNGYQFAGLQYGSECWCGNSQNAFKVSDDQCSMPCPGDSSSTCGAAWKFGLYNVNAM